MSSVVVVSIATYIVYRYRYRYMYSLCRSCLPYILVTVSWLSIFSVANAINLLSFRPLAVVCVILFLPTILDISQIRQRKIYAWFGYIYRRVAINQVKGEAAEAGALDWLKASLSYKVTGDLQSSLLDHKNIGVYIVSVYVCIPLGNLHDFPIYLAVYLASASSTSLWICWCFAVCLAVYLANKN